MNSLEIQLIKKLTDSGIHLAVSRQKADFSGYDIVISDKKIDLKAQTTNGRYDTVLLSLRHRNKKGTWILPGYLRRDDVYTWCYDSGDNCIWELSPEKLHYIETYAVRFFIKPAKTDYLGNEHFLAVIPKEECTRIDIMGEQ